MFPLIGPFPVTGQYLDILIHLFRFTRVIQYHARGGLSNIICVFSCLRKANHARFVTGETEKYVVIVNERAIWERNGNVLERFDKDATEIKEEALGGVISIVAEAAREIASLKRVAFPITLFKIGDRVLKPL